MTRSLARTRPYGCVTVVFLFIESLQNFAKIGEFQFLVKSMKNINYPLLRTHISQNKGLIHLKLFTNYIRVF